MNPVTRKIVSATLVCIGVSSFGIEASARKTSFQLPVQDKLSAGAGPTSPRQWERKSVQPGQSLAPVGLGEGESTDGAGNGYLTSSVSTSQYISIGSGANGTSSAADGSSKTVVGKGLGDKLLKDAKKVEVLPLALTASDAEIDKKCETIADYERQQLGDLWTATIGRNPDIQFVVNKLQPNSNANHAMANTMKFLSAALFGAMNVAPMMVGGGINGAAANPMAFMGMSSGASLIQSLFANQEQKNAKKQQISEEQATILYKMVRDTAEKLVANYRTYKKYVGSSERAATDYQDLQAMAAEARSGQDAAKQLEMEWTLRKAQRDLEKDLEEVRGRRQELVDFAGADAVVKLDEQLTQERIALKGLTGSSGTAIAGPAGEPQPAPTFQTPDLTKVAPSNNAVEKFQKNM